MAQGSFEKLSMAAGKILFREGEEIDKIYIIESGQVDLYKMPSSASTDQDLGQPFLSLKAGDVMGEVVLFGAKAFLSTAKTAEPTVLKVVSIESLMMLYEQVPKPVQKIVFTTLKKAQHMIESHQQMLSSVDRIQDSFGFLLGSFHSAFVAVPREEESSYKKADLQRYLFRIFGIRTDVFEKCLEVFEKLEVIEWQDEFTLQLLSLDSIRQALEIYNRVSLDPSKENYFHADAAVFTHLELLLMEGQLELEDQSRKAQGLVGASFQKLVDLASRRQLKISEGSLAQLKKFDLHVELRSTEKGVQLLYFPDEVKKLSLFFDFQRELSTSFN